MKNTRIKWISLIFLIILSVALIYYLTGKPATVKKTVNTEMPFAASPTPTRAPIAIPPGWKLFASRAFYFSFAYPPEKYRFVAQETERADADENSWRLTYFDATKQENLEALKNTSQILIRALPYDYDLEHYATIDYPAFFQDKKTSHITIGTIPGYLVEYTDSYSGIISTNVITFYRGHIYQITFASHNEKKYKEDLPLFETLLSTLQFTE